MIKKFFLLQFRKNTASLFRLFLILFLAVFGFIFSDNIVKNANVLIQKEAREVIGGDYSIQGSLLFSPSIDAKIENYKKDFGIEATKKLSLDTSISNRLGNPSLVSIDFVESNYPLVGKYEYDLIDEAGDILVDEMLMKDFVVDNTLTIGGKKYKVKGIIRSYPGTGFSFFTEGRKVFIPYKYAETSGLVSFGSRLRYEYLLLLPKNPFSFLSQFKSDNSLFSDYEIEDYKSSIEQISESIAEFDTVIKLFFIFAFIISIVCIFLTLESYITLEKKNFSLLVIFGLSQKKLLLYFSFFLFCFFQIAFLFAYVLNIFVLELLHLSPLASEFLLFSSSLSVGYIVGITILTLGTLFSLYSLFSLRPLDGLKPSMRFFSRMEILIQSIIVSSGMLLFLFFTLGFNVISFLSTGIIITVLLFLMYVFFLLFRGIFYVVQKKYQHNFMLYDVARFAVRPGNMTLIAIIPLFITFTLLFTFTSFSLSFLGKTTLLEGGNDTFIINIPKKTQPIIKKMFPNEASYDIIRGRIVSINNKTLGDHLSSQNVGGEFTREFNLTTNTLPNLQVLEGSPPKKGEVSVDADFAKRLKIELGNRIAFNIYGKEKEFTVTGVRESKRDGFTPFFYFQFVPEDFLGLPRTYFLATKLEGKSISELRKDIFESGGNQVNVIDLKATLEKIETILSTIIRFTLFLLIYIIAYNLLIIAISLHFLKEVRSRLSFLYHIFGASKIFVQNHLFFEYLYLIGVAGIFSLFFGIAGYGFLVYRSTFIDFDLITLGKTGGIMMIFFALILFFVWIQNLKKSKT